ncbi:hypothetical protein F4677DRAFT_451488 [Hypoxylon crocopeplum]|nr:hypothetical protein F4677DRAFT_451488 [Hypoxylon crocopeplum]
MHFIKFLGLSALLGAGYASAAAVAYPEGYVPTAEEFARDTERAAKPSNPELLARSSATGCVQAHCGYTGSLITGDNVQIEIYHNGQYIFYLSQSQYGWSDNTEITFAGLTDYRGNKWGFKAKGLCGALSYINTIQSDYGYYSLARTDNQWTTTECECNDDTCLKCTLYEAVYSDPPSGQCYGYHGLSMCDYRGYCGSANGNTKHCNLNSCW